MAAQRHRQGTARALALAFIIVAPVAAAILVSDDNADNTPGFALFVVFAGFVAFVYWPPIALAVRRGGRWTDVAVVSAAVLLGHAAFAVLADSTIPVFVAYLLASGSATWSILSRRRARGPAEHPGQQST